MKSKYTTANIIGIIFFAVIISLPMAYRVFAQSQPRPRPLPAGIGRFIDEVNGATVSCYYMKQEARITSWDEAATGVALAISCVTIPNRVKPTQVEK